MRRLLVVLACATVTAAVPARADAASELRVSLRAAPAFLDDTRSNCAQFYVNRLRPRGLATTRGAETGRLDLDARRGELSALAAEWQLGRIARPVPGRRPPGWLRFSGLGVRLDGRRVLVTAVVHRQTFPRGRRQVIGELRGARIEPQLMNDVNGRPRPSTHRTRITGRFALGDPITRAIRRTPCARARRPVRTGRIAGTLRFEHRPDVATGLAGRARVIVKPGGEDIGVVPTGGATPDGAGTLVLPITGGLPVPIVCTLGVECLPSGGTLTLGGGFDLVRGDARVSVTGIAVRASGTALIDVVTTITGVVDGAPITLVEEGAPDVSGASSDFVQRVRAKLGLEEAAPGIEVDAQFTRTGPA